jgi:nitric oxide dioxygenase
MLSARQREIVKATIPLLKQHGETITRRLCSTMLAVHPELQAMFSPAWEHDPGKARSLASSILTYAEHVDVPERLCGMIERISGRHGSFEVQAEHYPIVGRHFVGALGAVLGTAATPDVLDAWAAAYADLAGFMVGREREIYDEGALLAGSWRGFKPFRAERRVRESETMESFHLVPADGAPLPPFRAGQHLSVKLRPPGVPYDQIRPYSVSCAPNARCYRISVERARAPAGVPGASPGLVSNALHDTLHAGGTVEVHLPLGEFVLDEASDRPVVLLSDGAGIAAVLSMLEQLAAPPGGSAREVVLLHAVRGRASHAFAGHVRALERQRRGIRSAVFYEEVGPDDVAGLHYDAVGRITLAAIRRYLPEGEAEFYFCGPPGFVTAIDGVLDQLGIPRARRRTEALGFTPSFAADALAPV